MRQALQASRTTQRRRIETGMGKPGKLPAIPHMGRVARSAGTSAVWTPAQRGLGHFRLLVGASRPPR
jgi:hypothetical protein